MTLAAAGVAFLVLLVLGAPVWVFLGLPGVLAVILQGGVPLEAVSARVFDQLGSDTLVAVPLFILLGNVLSSTSGSRYLVEFIDTLVRQFPGGLALAAIGAGVFFAGITGSSTGEAAILAAALGPPMAAAGYDRRFTAGLLAATATLGILIPPSIPMLLFAAVTNESVGQLFVAGLLPGLFLALMLVAYVIVQSKRHGYGSRPAATWTERRRAFTRALPVLVIPVFIVVSLYSGFSTATESGAVAAALSLLAALAYRELSIRSLFRILTVTARTTSMLLIIVGTAAIFNFILTYGRAPQMATELVRDLQLGTVAFLLAMNVLLILLGVFLEPPPIIFITLPVIYPILGTLGISPVHFAVIMMVNLQLAQISPPVGLSLYAVSSLARIPIGDVFAGVMPFMALLVFGLLAITYIPGLSLLLVQ